MNDAPLSLRIVGGRIGGPGGLRPGDITTSGDAVGIGIVERVSLDEGMTREGSVSADDTANGDAVVTIDARGLIVSPGFIDLQINGGHGFDLVTDPGTMWDLGAELPRQGVTAFLPTIITSPSGVTEAALRALHRRPDDYVGAEPLGTHFEGPMLSPERPGAHPVEHLVEPDPSVIEGWSRADGVRLVTIAPELPGAVPLIAELVDRGVTVSAGHSTATADQVGAGQAAGVTLVTHLFNAMPPLDHRRPGLLAVALADQRLTAGLIVDGVHVDPIVVAAAWKAKGPDGIVLVSDAVAPMGCGPGTYRFAAGSVVADERCVRNRAGTLAGSILTMDQAVRNLVAFSDCSVSEALATVTANPARVIGEARRGWLYEGAVADLVLLDEELNIQLTVCRGRIAYVTEAARSRVRTDGSGNAGR